MNTLQEKISQEINKLPLNSQKEVLDFVLFLSRQFNSESDNHYLSKNAEIKQAIIDGLKTPLEDCSEFVDW
ncbi:MAG: hypothetical protein Q8N96_14660 [Methylovulum sp.]|nr:hypothetical protein [Methylovulum sp.]